MYNEMLGKIISLVGDPWETRSPTGETHILHLLASRGEQRHPSCFQGMAGAPPSVSVQGATGACAFLRMRSATPPLAPLGPPPPPPRPELMTGLFEDELGDSSSRSGCLLEQSHAEDAIGAGVVDAALALEVGDRLLMALRLASVHRASEVDGLDERVGSGLRERVPRLKVVLPRRGQRWVELVQPDGEVGCRRGDGGGGGGG